MSLRTNIVAIVIVLLSVTGVHSAFAAGKDSALILNDSAVISLRQPGAAAQDEIFSDDDWKYVTKENKSSNEDSFFGRLFGDLLRNLFDDMEPPDFDPVTGKPVSAGVNWWSLFFILIGAGLLVFFIIKATGAGGNTLFRGKSKRREKVDATLEDVDIHAINYDAEITGAISRNDYRFAVRLWFLRALKQMADQRLIDWKIDKTNTDYYYELSGSKLQKEFGSVSLLYDYIWYGDFKINEIRYRDAERELQQFHSRIINGEVKK